MNGIFKTLGIASDLWVCTMIFFVITTLVSKPANDVAKTQKQQVRIDSLSNRIKELEKINLAKSQSGRDLPNDGKQTEVFVRQNGISLNSDNATYSASSLSEFDALIRKLHIHSAVVLYCDARVPFERIVGIIDRVKQHHSNVTISLAAITD